MNRKNVTTKEDGFYYVPFTVSDSFSNSNSTTTGLRTAVVVAFNAFPAQLVFPN